MADDEQEIQLRFKHKKQQIIPSSSEPIFKDLKYVIFPTNNPKYFIKVYVFPSEKSNAEMAKLFSTVTSALNTQTNNLIRIFDVKNKKPIVAMLMESYDSHLDELIDKHYFTTNFDVYKFLFQMAHALDAMMTAKVDGFVLNGSSVVLGNNFDFLPTHFDKNVNEKNEGELGESSDILKNDLAPEYFESGVYLPTSNLWDLGVLLHRVLTGRSFVIDYTNKKINFDEKIEKVNPLFKEILEGLVAWEANDRIKPQNVVDLVSRDVSNLREFTMDPNVNSHVQDFANLIFNFKDQLKSDELNDFKAKYQKINLRQKRETHEIVSSLLSQEHMINNDLLQNLIRRGWEKPISHVEFYNKMFKKAKKDVKNNVIILKLLLVLHAYMHRSSKKSLMVVGVDNKEKNLIEGILDPIILAKISTNDSVIASYAIFLLKKFKLLFKHIKDIGSNFSIPKIEIISRWQKILRPDLFFDLLEYLQFVFSFLLKIKEWNMNYFTKNMLIFGAKEFISVIGALINLITLLEYTLNFNEDLSEEDREEIKGFIDYVVNICDNNRQAMDIHLKELVNNRKDLQILDRFIVNKDVNEHYKFLRKIIKERVEYVQTKRKKKEFSIKDFTRYFMNYIVRMPEALQHMSFKSQVKSMTYSEIVGYIKEINNNFLGLIRTKDYDDLLLLKVLPDKPKNTVEPVSSRKHVKQKEKMNKIADEGDLTVIKEDDESHINEHDDTMQDATIQDITLNESTTQRDPRNDTMVELNNPVEKNYGMNLTAKKRKFNDVSTQTDDLEEEEELRLLREEVAQLEAAEKEEKPVLVRQETTNLTKEEFDIHNLTPFIKQTFSRSVTEWIIDFNEQNFGKLIATGSTCHVYRGMYKNLPVAIKKLLRPENEKKIKFLKEFKREISLLISLPSHPSLLNLVGFVIEEGVVYLLTEFCEGGTLFDILYRRSLGFKISQWVNKKTKDKDTNRHCKRNAVPP